MSAAALTLQSPAKLNLFLHILGRRDDGYHELQTAFQLIDLCDTLAFDTGSAPDGVLSLRCDDPAVPLDDNLVLQAAEKLRQQAGQPHLAADMVLEKKIPLGGGLGGGSSNAATTLLALNRLWKLNLPRARLAEIGLELGADVPVFVQGRSAWAGGIGEQLEPLDLPARHYVIVHPRIHVATAEIFSHQQLTRDSAAIKIADFLAGGGRNDCESVVRDLHPEVDQALQWLNQFGQARLTGTGSCVFVGVDSTGRASAILDQVPARFQGYVASGLNLAPRSDML